MIKVKVYEIVERYFDVEDEVFVNNSIELPPFVNEDMAKEFCERCNNPKFKHYYNLNRKYIKSGSYLSYQPKVIEVFESLEEYDNTIPKYECKVKVETDSLETEME